MEAAGRVLADRLAAMADAGADVTALREMFDVGLASWTAAFAAPLDPPGEHASARELLQTISALTNAIAVLSNWPRTLADIDGQVNDLAAAEYLVELRGAVPPSVTAEIKQLIGQLRFLFRDTTITPLINSRVAPRIAMPTRSDSPTASKRPSRTDSRKTPSPTATQPRTC